MEEGTYGRVREKGDVWVWCVYVYEYVFNLYFKNIWVRVRLIWLQMGSYYPFHYLGLPMIYVKLHNKDRKR